MATATATDHYTIISADTHAGSSVNGYREYLDEKHKKLFDDWRGSYRNPQKKHIGSKKHKNWDDAERMADMKGDWNARAKENAQYYIASADGDQDQFRESGARDVHLLVLRGIRAHLAQLAIDRS